MKVKLVKPTPQEDAEIAAGIAADPDTVVMSDAQFEAAAAAKRKRGRPAGSVAESTKQLVSFRLDADIVEALKASGPKWQPRVNALLRLAFLHDRGPSDQRDALGRLVMSMLNSMVDFEELRADILANSEELKAHQRSSQRKTEPHR